MPGQGAGGDVHAAVSRQGSHDYPVKMGIGQKHALLHRCSPSVSEWRCRLSWTRIQESCCDPSSTPVLLPPMNISEFITRHMEQILVEWEAFATTFGAAADKMSGGELRDHAKQILEIVVSDIRREETTEQTEAKSHGQDTVSASDDSASMIHGRLRCAARLSHGGDASPARDASSRSSSTTLRSIRRSGISHMTATQT